MDFEHSLKDYLHFLRFVKDVGDLPGTWEGYFEQMKRFVVEYGRLPTVREGEVGRWCYIQRLDRRVGNLDPNLSEALEEVPEWTWTMERGGSWWNCLEALKRFVSKNGHLPQKGKNNCFYLWCRQQKQHYHDGTLTKEKIESLDHIPKWTW